MKDDTTLINLYMPRRDISLEVSTAPSVQINNEDVVALLSGIHTAASVEVLSFARSLGID